MVKSLRTEFQPRGLVVGSRSERAQKPARTHNCNHFSEKLHMFLRNEPGTQGVMDKIGTGVA